MCKASGLKLQMESSQQTCVGLLDFVIHGIPNSSANYEPYPASNGPYIEYKDKQSNKYPCWDYVPIFSRVCPIDNIQNGF